MRQLVIARRPFLKQKPLLYFDENFPEAVVSHFALTSYWKSKVKVTSASERGTIGRPDKFHYTYCQKRKYTLVTLDRDFDNDKEYPFTSGNMPGIIIIRANSSEVRQIIDILGRILTFLMSIPLPRSFLLETKFIAGRDNVQMRGRNAATKEIRSLQVRVGVTTIREICEFFDF
jgi:predicted nuclease of predicted toxin-antitoxin system